MFSATSGESLKDIKDRLNIRKRGPQARTTKCPVCRKEATGDVAACSACQGKTHFKCAQPSLDAVPSTPWFCDSCLTSQASGILEFLEQTRRILLERMARKKEANGPASDSDAVGETKASSAAAPAVNVAETGNDAPSPPAGAEMPLSDAPPKDEETPEAIPSEIEPPTGGTDSVEPVVQDVGDAAARDASSDVVERTSLSTPEEKFLALVESLIKDVSSKSDRTHIIANSTGATLVHLAKTLLVQLVESGHREIAQVATDGEVDDADAAGEASATPRLSEVDALVKIFDLRHQILSSQAHFQRTSSTLAKRTEKHLRVAEAELMALEESRAVEARAVNAIVDLIDQYDGELQTCQHKVELNQVLLASIAHRRNFIRATNVSSVFVPSYRLTTKQMSSSSDQLLYTVLLDKLRAIAATINEWAKMEEHFDKMTASLQAALVALGTKRGRDGAERPRLPPTPVLFARVKIPPSRRLIERQIANYAVNANAIKGNRASMRTTLAGVLKIAREEHLSAEIIDLTDLLYRKCRSMKGDDSDDADDGVKPEGDGEDAEDEEAASSAPANQEEDRESSGGAEPVGDEPALKKQRVEEPVSAGEPQESEVQEADGAARATGAGGAVLEDVVNKGNAPESNAVAGTSDVGARSSFESSGEEIQLSEASATLAGLAPDEEAATDSVAKYPSRSILLNMDELSPRPAPAPAPESNTRDRSESYPHESVDAASAVSLEHNKAADDDFSSARPSQASSLLDLPQPDAVLTQPRASQHQADRLFRADFAPDAGGGAFQLQPEAPKVSPLLADHGFVPPMFGQAAINAPQSKATKPSKDKPSDSALLLQQQQQQQRAEME
ncbi:hypothetical protein PybrP1_007784, partial [[Pythium] brassicae (nom. inval.)]